MKEKNSTIPLEHILEIPKKYGIGKRPLSLLLNWGEMTFSRYCNGDTPSKQYSDILMQIYSDPEFYLSLLEKNKDNLKSLAAYEKSRNATFSLLFQQNTTGQGYNIAESGINYLVNGFNELIDLDVILAEGESYTVEFKASADKSLPTEICAFANASGGRVFIGVSDNGKVVGTNTSNAARSKVQDSINQIEPRIVADIAVHNRIIVVTVPEGKNKPYACSKGFYLRSGPNSQKLERNSILEFFKDEGHIRYDEILREDLPLHEKFNEKAYKKYLRAANISEVLEKERILVNLKCAEYTGGKLCFTNAGALFFRINDEDVEFRHAGIVCALYKGTDKAYVIDAKEFDDDIVSSINDAIAFLKRHLNISFKIEGLRRKNILELPEDALREAVVNAVCHRDYFEKGARVMVEVFDDRVDITSPGGVCKGITADNFGKLSMTRNPLLASMLYKIDFIEQMGTGISKMKKAAKDANVAEPEFELHNFFKVTFARNKPNGGKDSDEYNDDGGNNGGENGHIGGNNGGDGGNLKLIVDLITNEPEVTISAISKRTNIPLRTIERTLSELKERGDIRRIGSSRAGHWEIMAKKER